MKLTACQADNAAGLALSAFDVSICGSVLDERGAAACEELVRLSASSLRLVDYDSEAYTVRLDDATLGADDLIAALQCFRGARVALEATTLGFVELFLALRACLDQGAAAVDVVYVEPGRYTQPSRSRTFILHRREFELSEAVPGYRAVPGATIMLGDRQRQRGVFFLGFEERRLDVAFEDFQMLRPRDCDVVFGVPAFRVGWEMDAFANNVRVMVDRGIFNAVHYCGANDPLGAHEILCNLFEVLDSNERMFIAPIGTKPHGIAAAMFAATHPGVGLLYDHPRRKPGRSEKTGQWHRFSIED